MSFINILMGLVLACQKISSLGRFNLKKINELVRGFVWNLLPESEQNGFFSVESDFLGDLLFNLNSILFEFRDVLEFVNVGLYFEN